jgi:hypothetical protein
MTDPETAKAVTSAIVYTAAGAEAATAAAGSPISQYNEMAGIGLFALAFASFFVNLFFRIMHYRMEREQNKK